MTVIADVRCVVRCLDARLRVAWLLRAHPLDVVLHRLDPTRHRSLTVREARSRECRDTNRIVGHIETATDVLTRRIAWARGACMVRALVRWRVCRQYELPVVFVMGAQPRPSETRGHAWVELNGEAIMEREAVDIYTETFRYPPNAPLAPGDDVARSERRDPLSARPRAMTNVLDRARDAPKPEHNDMPTRRCPQGISTHT